LAKLDCAENFNLQSVELRMSQKRWILSGETFLQVFIECDEQKSGSKDNFNVQVKASHVFKYDIQNLLRFKYIL
jgi:hypothetical protein